MLNKLAYSEYLSCETELVFDRRPWLDCTRGVVCSVEIPGIESGEVLNGPQHLVATNYKTVCQLPKSFDKRSGPDLWLRRIAGSA